MHLISRLTIKSILALINLYVVITAQCEVQTRESTEDTQAGGMRYEGEKHTGQFGKAAVTLNQSLNSAGGKGKW